jgi:ATP-dependent Zn protease
VSAALERATGWLQGHRQVLDRATEQLLQRETLAEQDLLALMGREQAQQPSVLSAR